MLLNFSSKWGVNCKMSINSVYWPKSLENAIVWLTKGNKKMKFNADCLRTWNWKLGFDLERNDIENGGEIFVYVVNLL